VTRLIPLALLTACRGAPVEGTSVGNPTELTARLAPSSDLIIDSAQVTLSMARFTDEQGGVEEMDLAVTVDVLGGGPLEVPDLEWVSFDLSLASPLELRGLTSGDAEASLTIDAESLETLWKAVIDELIVPAEEHFSVVSGPEALVTEIVRHRLASAVHRPGLAVHVLADGSAEGEVCSTTWRRRPAVAERSATSSSGRPWRQG